MGQGRLGEKIYVIHWEFGQRGKGDHSSFSATELRMGLEDLVWRSRRRGGDLPAAYFLSWQERPLS